ncbi:MAG: hypothetical protein AAGD14_08365 [Planctomycetota bacterium]
MGHRALGTLIGTLILLAGCASAPLVAGDHDQRREWRRDGAWYRLDNRRVPAGVADRLRQLALAAESDRLPPALDLEPDEERRFDVYDMLLEGFEWLLEYADDEDFLEMERVPDRKSIEKAARLQLSFVTEGEMPPPTFSLALPGQPAITIESRDAARWTVETGGTTRELVSFEMTRLALLFADPQDPWCSVAESSDYWQRGFWRDDLVWDLVVGAAWRERFARRAIEALPGWKTTWTLRKADAGHYSTGDAISVELVSPDGTLVVDWHCPFDAETGELQGTAAEADAACRKLVAFVQANEQARAWPGSGPKRTVKVSVIGEGPFVVWLREGRRGRHRLTPAD